MASPTPTSSAAAAGAGKPPGCVAYEMVYGKGETAFLAQARAAGAKTCLDGLGMLVCQGAESFRLWTGLTPDVEPVLARMRPELNA